MRFQFCCCYSHTSLQVPESKTCPSSLFAFLLHSEHLLRAMGTAKYNMNNGMSMPVFWAVTPHGPVGRYQCFSSSNSEDGNNMFLWNMCPHGITAHKTIFTTKKTSNLILTQHVFWYQVTNYFSSCKMMVLQNACNIVKTHPQVTGWQILLYMPVPGWDTCLFCHGITLLK